MNQREKAARIKAAIDKVIIKADNGDHDEDYYSVAVTLQVAVDEAAELIDRLLGEVVGPFADKTIVVESADWLSRNERKEV